jgi:hypothetical protein
MVMVSIKDIELVAGAGFELGVMRAKKLAFYNLP